MSCKDLLWSIGDLADSFIKSLTNHSKMYHCIIVTFDRYIPGSVKGATRKRRSGTCCPMRRAIKGCHGPLPKNWDNFLCMSGNKSDLARFLSQEIIRQGNLFTGVVVAGAFDDGVEVQATNVLTDV